VSASLKRAIDRMVEDAIRRILPGVMNEVLVATIARGTSEIVSERRSQRPRKVPKKRKVVREQRASRRDPPQSLPQRKVDLSDILDESVGAEFYHDPRSLRAEPEPIDDRIDHDEDDLPEPIAQRIQSLPPELQSLAEGIVLDDDGGEMWGANEHDSGTPGVAIDEVRDLGSAAKRAGMDFSRMKGLINATSPSKKVDRADAQAKAQFEAGRIKRMRELLNGGKPVE